MCTQAKCLGAGTRFDVRNVPDEEGSYEGEGLVFSIDFLRQIPVSGERRSRSNGLNVIAAAQHDGLVESFTRCLAGLRAAVPEMVMKSRLVELVAWLREEGIEPLSATAVSARLRLKRLISAEPAKPWRLWDAARQLGLGKDTLQRQLRRDGATFQEVLAETRMEHALTMLWTTNHSVARIGRDSGYESQSRFALRFRDRFGLPPSVLRSQR